MKNAEKEYKKKYLMEEEWKEKKNGSKESWEDGKHRMFLKMKRNTK